MEEKQKGALDGSRLILGASLISIMDYQNSNTESKFAYLMRHPTSSNEIGTTVTEAVIHSAQLSVTGRVNNWITMHVELLYDPEQSFGAGTITALTRNQIQLRKGYVLLGDLDEFPLFLAVGKMDAPFGQTGTVSPFTNSTMWHAFGGLGYGAHLGLLTGGLNVNFMLVQGGAQFRALHNPNNQTAVPNHLDNFVADINYTIGLGKEGSDFKLGGSYVKGTAYCQNFPVVHFTPCDENNPGYSFYGMLNLGGAFTLKGSFAKTTKEWPGTFNPNPPLDQYAASKVSSLDIGARYKFNRTGNVVYAVSGEFSNFVAGPDGSPWERQNQIVLGLSGMIKQSSKLFIEAFNTKGYAPLNFISGGNQTDPGTTHSDIDATSIGIVIGAQLTF
jgi:hypothetical protein